MYYGQHKIASTEVITQNEKEFVRIHFEGEVQDGETVHIPDEVTSQALLEYCQSEEPLESQAFYEKRLAFLRDVVMNTLVDHNVYEFEVQALLRYVDAFYESVMKAMDDAARGEPEHRKSLFLANKILGEQGQPDIPVEK